MTMHAPPQTSTDCRLCEGGVERQFTLRVLGKYDVDYLRCAECGSLQTVAPFWLGETYGGDLQNLDTGAARRAARTCAIILLATTVLGIPRTASVLDFGGGDGLVCRMLRDAGYDSYVYDKYAKNFYADGYAGHPDRGYDVVCAVEVLEHLAVPTRELDMMFSALPQLVMIATDRYHGQGPEWPYLGSDQGGHVFFYSDEAMAFVAKRYGYDLVTYGTTAVFVKRRLSRWRRAALSAALRSGSLLAGRMWLQFLRPQRAAPPPR